MNEIISFSDAHENPNSLSDNLRQIIRMAKADNARLVSVGDLANLLPWGFDAFVGSKFIGELKEELDGYQIDLVGGNHDPHRWLKKLFADTPNIKIHKRLQFFWGWGLFTLHFRHGHGWSPDWFILRYFAPSFVEFMADYCPRFSYWLSRKMGWLPSAAKPKTGLDTDEENYHMLVFAVWYKAIKYAKRNRVHVIVGHTHDTGLLPPLHPVFADGGTLMEGSYLRISNTITLCKLGQPTLTMSS